MPRLFGRLSLSTDSVCIGHLLEDESQENVHILSFGKNRETSLAYFISYIHKLFQDKRPGYHYLYFASRFYEMPLLALESKRQTMSQEDFLDLLIQRRKYLTSLDSPFSIMKKHPELWTRQESNLLSQWLHNEHFLDIRTLDGRIEHGELGKFDRYCLEMGWPLPSPTDSQERVLKLELSNLAQLFHTKTFQESFKAHYLLMRDYQGQITRDPKVKWAGMMTIQETSTDADTIEAILYRDHPIGDSKQVSFKRPELRTTQGQSLVTYYETYLGIDHHKRGALASVHKKNRDFKPPIWQNPDGTFFTLLPSENGLYGITINREAYQKTRNWRQMNDFSQTIRSERISKIEGILLYQRKLLELGAFDKEAEPIVREMVNHVLLGQNDLRELAYQRTLYAIRGLAEVNYDNYLKQENRILSVYLECQLEWIALIEDLLELGVSIYSVNSMRLYAHIPSSVKEDVQVLLAGTLLTITDQGSSFTAKSSNNHVYLSDTRGLQAAGDGVNHYEGPNVVTDQQRPTIVEKIVVDYLIEQAKTGILASPQSIIDRLDSERQQDFNPIEWIQPLLSSPLKNRFAFVPESKRLAQPAIRAFYVKPETKGAVSAKRLYLSNRKPGQTEAQDWLKQLPIGQNSPILKDYAYFEKNSNYANKNFLIIDDLSQAPDRLKDLLDLTAYQEQVLSLLDTWQ